MWIQSLNTCSLKDALDRPVMDDRHEDLGKVVGQPCPSMSSTELSAEAAGQGGGNPVKPAVNFCHSPFGVFYFQPEDVAYDNPEYILVGAIVRDGVGRIAGAALPCRVFLPDGCFGDTEEVIQEIHNDLSEDLLFAPEVVIDGPLREFRPSCDLIQRRIAVAALCKDLLGSAENFLPAGETFPFPSDGRRRGEMEVVCHGVSDLAVIW